MTLKDKINQAWEERNNLEAVALKDRYGADIKTCLEALESGEQRVERVSEEDATEREVYRNSVCPMKANVFSRKIRPAGVEARPP